MTTAHLGHRDLFPLLQPDVYLNHAAISPPSTPVRDNVLTVLDGYGQHGVAWFHAEAERRDRVRGLLAGLMNADAANVALVGNTSAGVINIAQCVRWQPGDQIVLFRGDFPANVTPWLQAAEQHALRVTWLDAEDFRLQRDDALRRFEELLCTGVRLVAVSAVQFQTGQQMPIGAFGALCRRHGAELFVDAIQCLGMMPLDVEALGIHYLTAGGHKWLMGPEGIGVLYVHPASAKALRPAVASWLSHDEPFGFLFEGAGHLRYDRPIVKTARFVEAGAANAMGAAGLEASLDLLSQLGTAAIYEHVQAWHDAIEPGLRERGFVTARMSTAAGRSGILSMKPPAPHDAPWWVSALAERGVSCACPDGWLRMAPHWPNALDETVRVLAAIDAVLGRPR